MTAADNPEAELAELLDDLTADMPEGVVCVAQRELSLLVCCALGFALGTGARADIEPGPAEELWSTVIRNGARVGYSITRPA